MGMYSFTPFLAQTFASLVANLPAAHLLVAVLIMGLATGLVVMCYSIV